MANEVGQLDTSIEIITPENIAFRYRVAGPFRRLPAYLIDLAIRGFVILAALIVSLIVFGIVGLAPMGFGLVLVLWFLLSWFYGGLFETFFNGRTPGKMLLQIRVVSVDGQPINGLQAVLRNVLRTIDMQPGFFCVLGLLTATMNNRFQRLGDLACATMVVIEEQPWLHGVVRIQEAEVARTAAQIPANFEASRTLGKALAAYMQRRRTFSWGRRLEIARHLGEPLRERFDLPAGTNLDLLLCAAYQRAFITDHRDEADPGGSPFLQPQSPFARFDQPAPASCEVDSSA